MSEFTPVRILVVGDDNVGKSALVQALCDASSTSSHPGCNISVRFSEEPQCIEEFYDVTGDPRFRHGRSLFFSLHRYDAVIFVYDATDTSTRSSVSCTWVPEVMRFLGDVGAIEAGGRLDGTDVHVKSIGVLNEIRFLWRHTFLSHSTVSIREALMDTSRLVVRLVRLWLNETGLWPDSNVDQEAEAAFLATSTVPVAIVAMKSDLDDLGDSSEHDDQISSVRGIAYIRLHKFSAAHNVRLRSFLKRSAETAKRKQASSKQQVSSPLNARQVTLSFM